MTYVKIGQKELKTAYPITSGLIAGTTSQTGRTENLIPVEGSTVPKRDRVGIK